MKSRIVRPCFFIISICLYALSTLDALAYKHEERSLTGTEKTHFAILKEKFPGELLDPKFNTLRTLAGSTVYFDFLSQIHPKLTPFTNFWEDFDRQIMPPKARYLKFCQEYLNIPSAEEITDDEHYLIHHIATSSWGSEAAQRGGDRVPNLQNGKPFRLGHVLAFKPIGKEIFQRRKGKPGAFAFVLLTAQEHLDEDVRWIKVLFEKYGQSDGFLYIALQDPILFYRILYAFRTDTAFLKCVYDPIDLDAERRQRLGLDKK